MVYVSNGPGAMAPVNATRKEKEKIIQNEEIIFISSFAI
jgi:hypothetical protein